MAEMKTTPNDGDVDVFLASIDNERRRDDAREVSGLMTRITGEPPTMWGNAIIGFGSYHYRYASGREGDAPLTGKSPRKQNLTVYVLIDMLSQSVAEVRRWTFGGD